MQTEKMLFCPFSGERGPVPDSVDAWRRQHQVVWLFNPWTGERRGRREIERDAEGRTLVLSRENPSLLLWDSLFAKVHGAHGAMLGLEQAGWTCDLDYEEYVVTASRGVLKLAFRLTEPAEEERLYILLHDETLLRVVIR